MPTSTAQILLNHFIAKKAFLKDYPKAGVTFLAIDPAFSDSHSREIAANVVLAAVKNLSYDSVAGIASRGLITSGIIANNIKYKGEQFVQKVKVEGDPRFVQVGTKTEYSTDKLQVLDGIIQKDRNYLLTDDLIATGGSVLSAIKLIRAGGGQVKTVFVMTELTDLGARELLKQAGVELISLIKLSENDLQQLLIIQDEYAANKEKCLPYQLSQHAGELTPTLHVHVASTSVLKKDGAEFAFKEMLEPLTLDLVGHKVSSGVSLQPRGFEETAKGARNRLAAMRREIPEEKNSILVSVENGLRYSEDDGRYYDFVHVIIEKDGVTTEHAQDCCMVPPNIVEELNADKNITWGEIALRRGYTSSSENPHKEVIFGGVSREIHINKAINQAIKKMNAQQENIISVPRTAKFDLKQPNNLAKYIINEATDSEDEKSEEEIDLYNHGCTWPIDAEKTKQNYFQIFPTGDAFSLIKHGVKIERENVNIHVGVHHPKLSPLVLLQEALQLCRAASEHNAKKITIALPESYHPMLHSTEFNVMLVDLFKVSGASSIYYYDSSYKGNLSEAVKTASCNKESILRYLDWNIENTLDEKIAHYHRKIALEPVLARFEVNQEEVTALLNQDVAPEKFTKPAIKNPPHIVLCCSANRPFANEVADNLKARGEQVKIINIEGKGELAQIPQDAKLCDATITIVQSTRPNPEDIETVREYETNGASSYLFEAMMVARQARLRGAKQINLVNPYQFSARSDKAEDNQETKEEAAEKERAGKMPKGKTGAYVQQNGWLLTVAGVNNVFTAECHDPHTLSGSYTGRDIKGSAVPAITLMATAIAKQWMSSSHPGQLRLVTPDAGAAKRTKELGDTMKVILAEKFCNTRVLGEKERTSHEGDSARIKEISSGSVAINGNDKYLITDDEAATCNTICQSILGMKNQGAKDISIALAHNNMTLNWLDRQLSLARFFLYGVNDLHFSDTQEMGTFAKDYNDLIQTYSKMSSLPTAEVEKLAFKWFEKNAASCGESFETFKLMVSEITKRTTIHHMAGAFVDKLTLKVKPKITLAQNTNSFFAASNNQSQTVAANDVTSALSKTAAMQ